MRKILKWILVVGFSCVLLVVAVAGITLRGDQAWRRELLVRKARGDLPRMSWIETLKVVRPGSGFWMDQLNLDWEGANANLLIKSPIMSEKDLETARSLFLRNCTACHGADAGGTAVAPSLSSGVPKHAVSDWSTYGVIRRGIPGTSMLAHDLGWKQQWLLVGYILSLRAPQDAEESLLPTPIHVSSDELVSAAKSPENWLMFSGTYDGQRFSRLNEVNRSNVGRLEVRWLHQLDGNSRQQSVPLVVDGIMYFSTPPANVLAVDASTGRKIWSHNHEVAGDVPLCCGVVNRGLAVSGDLLFLGTVDAHLVALDAASGDLRWEKKVADYRDGYSITAAPLAVNDLVLTGVGGGEYPTRGFIAAYRAKDGTPVWRFDTVPKPGERGSESWEKDSWESGGGSTWMTGSFDPDTNLIYWGIGNPAPTYDGTVREGDNLYTDSVVALNATSGKLVWHFQFTPHDVHGWDSAQIPVLFKGAAASGTRKLLAWPNRNGFFYSLEADTGKFLTGRPFVKQTWASGLSADGRPIRTPGSLPSVDGSLVWPSDTGGTLWWPPALDPDQQLLFVPTLERGGVYFSGTLSKPESGKPYHGGGVQGAKLDSFTAVRALDAGTGELRWEHRFPARSMERPEIGGLLATDGGLLLGSDRSTIVALDSKTGNLLWSFDVGAPVIASPITYSVKGRQHIAVMAGEVLLAFTLPFDSDDAGKPAGDDSAR